MAKIVNVRLDLKPLESLVHKLLQQPVTTAMAKDLAVVYAAQVRRHFASQGGGSWEKLSAETLRKRRREGKGAKILRDTGTLLNALSVGGKGNLTQRLPFGVRFGVDNTGELANLVKWHSTGAGHNPKREILVDPSQQTISRMTRVVARHLGKLL